MIRSKFSFITILCAFSLMLCSCGPFGIIPLAGIAGSSGGGGGGSDAPAIPPGKVDLTVYSSVSANATPSIGQMHLFDIDDFISCSVDLYANDGNPTRYKSSGWTGTGDVPASGFTNNTGTFQISTSSTITWLWDTQYEVTTTANDAGRGTAALSGGSPEGSYYPDMDTVTIEATANAGSMFDHWEVNSATYSSTNPDTLSINEPKDIVAFFVDAPGPPVPGFHADATVVFTSTIVNFYDDSSGIRDTWNWDIDNDGTDEYSTQDISHTYSSPGIYSVNLEVSGIGGTSSLTKFDYIIVYDGNIYVNASSGDDSNYGTTWGSAVRSIQRGINLASDGMTVLCADGTFDEHSMDYNGKNITVKSLNGYGSCTINCGGSGRAFHFHNGETLSAVLEGFRITNGYVDSSYGGAILCENASSPTIRLCQIDNCQVTGGTPYGYGGAIAGNNSEMQVIGSIITNCTSRGGAFWLVASTNPHLTWCSIANNSTDGHGGGIEIVNGGATIENCDIVSNTTSNAYGGAIICHTATVDINNCNISNNSATTYHGGALYIYSSTINISNCTIANNMAADMGGAAYITGNSDVSVYNSIAWGNTATNANQVWVESGCMISLDYCCYSGKPDDYGGGAQATITNSMTEDPMFRDSASGDFRLKPGTPCFNIGNNSYALWSLDLDGNARLDGGTVDLGAFELNVIDVPSAYANIDSAITAATVWDVILLADGTYTGTNNKDLDFNGKKIGIRSANGPVSCTIDCENSGRAFIFQNNETDNSAVVGLTLRNGNPVGNGGAILCDPGSPYISHCDITNNSAGVNFGGGICIYDSSPTIKHSTITNNSATTVGGGGIYWNESGGTVSHCWIADNVAMGGGALCFESNSIPFIINSILIDNSASFGGGIHSMVSSNPTLLNCTIADNSCVDGGLDEGGGISCNDSSIIMTNCILWDNSAANMGNQICLESASASVTLNNCVYGNGPNDVSGSGTVSSFNCIYSDPLFRNPASNDYRLKAGTPCLDKGDGVVVAWDRDFDDEMRFMGAQVDIGPYELNTINVPGDYSSIQAAINAANDWDAVLVENGTYFEGNLDFQGKSIAVRSLNGPEFCTIDSQNTSRCFWFHNGENEDSALIGFTITNGNSAGSGGGGIRCEGDSDPMISNCVIEYNTTTDTGGGIHCSSSSPLIINCIIANNTGNSAGGISCSSSSNPVLKNCLIADNAVVDAGGGVYFYGNCYPELINCTIANNSAGGNAGGIYAYDSYPMLDNTIIWGNTAVGTGEQILVGGTTEIMLNLCCYSTNVGDIAGSGTVSPFWCINNDPQFRNSATGDYKLKCGSPCFDRAYEGDIDWLADIDGTKRIQGKTVDMGAFEINVIRVPEDRPTIQAAIDNSSMWDIILLTESYYSGAGNIDIDYGGRTIAIRSINGAHRCEIDCQGTNAANARGFWFHNGENSDCVLEGVRIRNGYVGDGYSVGQRAGGGIFISSGSPTIRNCIIESCHAEDYSTWPDACGGGICIYGSNSYPLIINCEITGNSAVQRGGGIFSVFASGGVALPIRISNCLIANNTTTGDDGAGLAIWGSGASAPCYVLVTNCTIANNSATGSSSNGGGIANLFQGITTLRNTIVWGNSATSVGNDVAISGTVSVVNADTCDIDSAGISGTITWINSNLNSNPLFLDATGDFHLFGGPTVSPCIGRGDNSFVTWSLDLDERKRIWGSGVDLGCYEGGRLIVPSGYATIQDAIDDASNGDIIVLLNGMYTGTGNKNLNFNGKSLMLTSAFGIMNCTIDCENSGRAFTFNNGETQDAIVNNIGIINANNSAIYCDGSDPVIINCIIDGNTATHGAGIWCLDASPMILGCRITNNSTPSGGGAGLCFWGECYPLIINCTLADNTSNYSGGAIRAHVTPDAGELTIINCIFWNNSSTAGNDDIGGEFWSDVSYSNINPAECTNVQWGDGNIFTNPLFASTEYDLQSSSPCVDVGINGAVLWKNDIFNLERIYNGKIDMGGFEYVAP